MSAPNSTLAAVIGEEIRKAQRGGMPLESCIATLIAMAEHLQAALPYVRAAAEYESDPT